MEIALRKPARLLLIWAVLFVGMGFLIWIGVRFWSPVLQIGPSPSVSLEQAGTLPALYPSDSAPIFDIGALAQSPQEFIGRRVEFHDLTVTATEGSTFRVQGDGGQTLVAAPWSEEPPGLSAGEKVSLSGLILNMPRVKVMQEQWGISAAQAGRLEQDKVYLRASTIDKSSG